MMRATGQKSEENLKTPLIKNEAAHSITHAPYTSSHEQLLNFFSTPLNLDNTAENKAEVKESELMPYVYSVFNIPENKENDATIAEEEKQTCWYPIKKLIADMFFPPVTPVEKPLNPLISCVELTEKDEEVLSKVRDLVVTKIDQYIEAASQQTSCLSFFMNKLGTSREIERAEDLRMQLTYGKVSGHVIADNLINFIRFGTTEKHSSPESFARDTLRGQLIDLFIPVYGSYAYDQQWLRNVLLKQRSYLDPTVVDFEILGHGMDMTTLLQRSYALIEPNHNLHAQSR